MLAYLIVLVVLAGAFYLISAPLRAARRDTQADRTAARLAELEAARDAKYREIRDAELDLHTGKLSADDYQAIDRTLRSEAIGILRRLDEIRPAADPAQTADDPAAEPAGKQL